MAWCPECKLEYVDGIKICPDCKSALVDSLDIEEEEIEEEIEEMLPYMDELPSDEERLEMIERIKKAREIPNYKSQSDAYEENRSGAIVLVICGLIGALALLLNAFGVFNFPIYGFSLSLIYAVMGSLFFIFIVMGIRSFVKLKALKPLVDEEKANIDKVTAFIDEKKKAGIYKAPSIENYEEEYLALCEKVVNDLNEAFPELDAGFNFYVVDRFADLDTDED